MVSSVPHGGDRRGRKGWRSGWVIWFVGLPYSPLADAARFDDCTGIPSKYILSNIISEREWYPGYRAGRFTDEVCK